jgi:thiol-disulfide isomerase/thioredoxin
MRRQRPAFLLIFCAMLAAPVRAQESGGISWMHDLEAAKVQAKQSGRLVLVHFWTPTCGPCLALEQHVFNQAGVASAIEGQFVPVKLNADENSATAQWFGITRVPTDVVVTPDGEIVGKLVSPPTPGAYIAETTGLATKYATRLGQTYAKAAGMAPVQPKINAAYANLQVSPTTPLAAAPPAAVTSNAVPPGSMTPVGSQPASVPFSPNPPMTAALQPALDCAAFCVESLRDGCSVARRASESVCDDDATGRASATGSAGSCTAATTSGRSLCPTAADDRESGAAGCTAAATGHGELRRVGARCDQAAAQLAAAGVRRLLPRIDAKLVEVGGR